MNKTARHFLKDAIDYYKVGRYLEALIACDNSIKLDSSFARAYHGRALASVQLKKYEGACGDFQRACKLDPDNAKIHGDAGEFFYFLENYKQSGLYYRKAINLDIKYASIYEIKTEELITKAFEHQTNWQYDSKYIYLKKAVLFNPEHERAKYYLSCVLIGNSGTRVPSYMEKQPRRTVVKLERELESNLEINYCLHTANCRCVNCWEP